MATVIKAAEETGQDTASRAKMQDLITRYWGSASEEKIFPIPLWKINQFIDASSTKEVALRVSDIDNPSLVNAEWIVFEKEMTDLSADQLNNDYYFVFNQNMLNQLKKNIPVLTKPLNTIILLGRIGKEENSNIFTSFILAADYALMPIGAGGNGLGTGIRLPPQP
jgi:hypothetical protein